MVQTTKKAELIFSGRTLPRAEAYIPDGRIVQRGIEKHYIRNSNIKVYNPEMYKSDWNKSETRKKEILANITAIRAEMKEIAISRRKVTPTQIVTPVPEKAKSAIKSLQSISNFVSKLFAYQEVKCHLHDIRNYTISN